MGAEMAYEVRGRFDQRALTYLCRVARTAPGPANSSLAMDSIFSPQTDGVQVHAEDVGAAVQSLQAGEVLLTGFHLQGSTMACSSASSGSVEISKGWQLSSRPVR